MSAATSTFTRGQIEKDVIDILSDMTTTGIFRTLSP